MPEDDSHVAFPREEQGKATHGSGAAEGRGGERWRGWGMEEEGRRKECGRGDKGNYPER